MKRKWTLIILAVCLLMALIALLFHASRTSASPVSFRFAGYRQEGVANLAVVILTNNSPKVLTCSGTLTFSRGRSRIQYQVNVTLAPSGSAEACVGCPPPGESPGQIRCDLVCVAHHAPLVRYAGHLLDKAGIHLRHASASFHAPLSVHLGTNMPGASLSDGLRYAWVTNCWTVQ